MPGPRSAPNGFRRVKVTGGGNVLATTGKTKLDHESGKWMRRLQNRRARGERDKGIFVTNKKR